MKMPKHIKAMPIKSKKDEMIQLWRLRDYYESQAAKDTYGEKEQSKRIDCINSMLDSTTLDNE